MKKKFITITLCAALLAASAVPAVTAAGNEAYGYAQLSDSGSCGENLTWTLSGEGELVISGEGEMFSGWKAKKEAGENIKSVRIESGVTSIGDYAFFGCGSLTDIQLPATLETIGISAFEMCDKLKHAYIPDNVVSISEWAFAQCGSLEDVSVCKGIRRIHERAFAECASLKSITVEEGNDSYSSHDGVLFYHDTKLIQYPLAAEAEEYAVPEGTEIISQYAFRGCSQLEKISLPDSVHEVEDGAFAYSPKLEEISVSESNSEISSDAGVLFTDRGATLSAYPAGRTDEEYTVPDEVEAIREYAFAGSQRLVSVCVPQNTYFIGQSAIRDCPALKEARIYGLIDVLPEYMFCDDEALEVIYLPSSLRSIDLYSLAGCGRLSDLYYNGTEEMWDRVFVYDTDLFNNTAIHYTGYEPVTITTISTKKLDDGKAWNFETELGKYYDICYISAAAYSKDGALVSVNRSILAEDLKAEVSIPKSDDIYMIRIFAWTEDMQPVANSEVVMRADEAELPELAGYKVENPWAVFCEEKIVEGERCAEVLHDRVRKTIPFKDTAAMLGSMSAGDVFFFLTNEQREIIEAKPVSELSSLSGTYRDLYNTWLSDGEDALINTETARQFADSESGVFGREHQMTSCRIIAGPIVNTDSFTDHTGGISTKGVSVYIATDEELARSGQSAESCSIDRVREIELAHDAAVYVYDYSVSREKNRVSVGTKSEVNRSVFDRKAYVGDKADNIINFRAELDCEKELSSNENYGNVKFVIAKIVDNEITEMLLIVPDDEM